MLRPNQDSDYLFCTRYGTPHINEHGEYSGFDSMWKRFMDRVLKETKVEERFTDHDIRAKAGSDSDTDFEASELLTHSNPNTTKKWYRRKVKKIAPLNRKNRIESDEGC